jgi:hypothetical protein
MLSEIHNTIKSNQNMEQLLKKKMKKKGAFIIPIQQGDKSIRVIIVAYHQARIKKGDRNRHVIMVECH